MKGKPVVVGLGILAMSVGLAQVKINFWHSMGGVNGEATEAIVKDFNAAQKESPRPTWAPTTTG